MTKPIIPAAALAQHIAILGKTGSGKTFAARAVIVEPLLEAGRRVAIVDPTGAWWGLRSSPDGTRPGYPVLILGGDHGDVPLSPDSGGAVASLSAEQGFSLVADTSLLTVGERTRWFIDFAGALYRLNKSPLNLVLDEAHVFAPQGKVPDPQTGRMLHAANALASGGRSRGIRLTMITQRPQKLHKDALTSADTLIVLRVLAPQDRKAVEDWIAGADSPIKGREVLASLAQLQRGEGWVWYPEGSHLERVRFPSIATFDSSATPVDGAAIAEPTVARIDMEAVRAALGEDLKKAQEADPVWLLAELKKARFQINQGFTIDDKRKCYFDGFIAGEKVGFSTAQSYFRKLFDQGRTLPIIPTAVAMDFAKAYIVGGDPPQLNDPIVRVAPVAGQHERDFQDTYKVGVALKKNTVVPLPTMKEIYKAAEPEDWKSAPGNPGQRHPAVKAGLARIMTALAQCSTGLTAKQIGIRGLIAATSGTFSSYIKTARDHGWIEGTRPFVLTPAGLIALGEYVPLPTGEALRRHWVGELESGAARLFQVVCDFYPAAMSREAAGKAAGLSPSSGTFSKYLAKLRDLELIDVGNGLRASDDLFQK